MIYNIIFIFFITYVIYYILNKNINRNEYFVDILKLANNNITKKNSKEYTYNKKCSLDNSKNIFRKSIYVSYSKHNSKYIFTILNYKYQYYMKIKYSFDEINIYDIKNKIVGNLIYNKYNKYYFNLTKIYNSNFYMDFINNYDKLSVYSQNRNIVIEILKNHDKFKIIENNICIGEILQNLYNYKINIDYNKKYLLTLVSICLSLFIKNN